MAEPMSQEIQGFDPDAYLASKQGASPSPSPSETPIDQTQIDQFNPDSYLNNKAIEGYSNLQKAHGTTSQQVLAGIEAVARGASLGTSDFVESRTGLSTPEAIQGRIAANPSTSFLGNVVGSGGLLAVTGGLGGLAEGVAGKLGAGLAGKVAGEAAVGSILGGGNLVSDIALGDTDVNAQKVLSTVGLGAAIGGGFGALGTLSKAVGAIPAMFRKATGGIDTPALVDGLPTGVGSVVDVPESLGKVPRSLQEMERQVEEAKKYGGMHNLEELPQKEVAEEAAREIGPSMILPPNEMQLDSLSTQDARNEFKVLLDLPGENGQRLRNYQAGQKRELVDILDNTINKRIAPGYDPTTNAIEGGERAAQSFTDAIQKNDAELKPAIAAIKNTPLANMDHFNGVTDYLTNRAQSKLYGNPGIADMFDTSGDSIQIKPYNGKMAIEQTTYNKLKTLFNDLKESPTNFNELFNLRSKLTSGVNILEDSAASKQLTQAKAAMMDYIQDSVQAVHPDQAVRDIFKRYAMNQENRQLIEEQFGAEIGSNNWRTKAKGPDEKILSKVFGDSNTTAAAKAILPPEDFNRMLADHLSVLRHSPGITDNGVFSSNKFWSAINRNQSALDTAFSDNAPPLQRIRHAVTLARIFPDAPSINPSGTAKTLIQGFVQAGFDPFKQIANAGEWATGKGKDILKAREINAKLAAQSDASKKLSSIQSLIGKVSDQIISGAKSALTSNPRVGAGVKGAIISGATILSDREFDKIQEILNKYTSNPQSLIENMADNSSDLHNAAPNITSSMHSTMSIGVGFLQSKLPQSPMRLPLSPKFEPSTSQKAAFSKYYNAVQEPISALKDIRNGTLSDQTMETLQAVYPPLLNEMKQQVISHMDIDKVSKLPYAQRLSLSKFLGQPLDGNMTPQGVMSNQASFSAPQLSKQNAPSTGMRNRSTLGGLKQLKFGERASTRDTEEA